MRGKPSKAAKAAKDKRRAERIKADPVRLEKKRAQQRAGAQRYREKHPERRLESVRAWTEQNAAAHHRKVKYGITRETFEAMLIEQRGKCAICRKPERVIDPRTGVARALAVDHCHETGAIRGLLCYRCNTGIGLLDHNEALLENAIDYLERSRCAAD